MIRVYHASLSHAVCAISLGVKGPKILVIIYGSYSVMYSAGDLDFDAVSEVVATRFEARRRRRTVRGGGVAPLSFRRLLRDHNATIHGYHHVCTPGHPSRRPVSSHHLHVKDSPASRTSNAITHQIRLRMSK
jgi:hypothetical protein